MYRATLLSSVIVAATVLNCSSSPDTAAPAPTTEADGGDAGPKPLTSQEAIDHWWATIIAGDINHAGEPLGPLLDAVKLDPNNGLLLRITGFAYAWRLAEDSVAVPPMDNVTWNQAAVSTGQYMKYAVERVPQDYHSWSHYAGDKITGAYHGLGTPQDIADAVQIVREKVIPVRPTLGYFQFASTMRFAPAKDSNWQIALEGFYKIYEICLGRPLDKSNPDFSNFEALKGDPSKRECFNQPHVPHAEEGLLFTFGDAMVKNQQVDVARKVYAAVKTLPNYAKWPWKSVLDERLTEDLDARAAIYAKDELGDGPPTGAYPHECTNCHQESP